MSRRKIYVLGIYSVLVLGGLAGWRVTPVAAQFVPPTQSQAERDMQDRQLKEANKKRQQDIRNDTEKLFQLATELKAAVDKSNENLLSLEVVKKADEVEKLAKRVKEKMKEAVGPGLKVDPVRQGPVPGRL